MQEQRVSANQRVAARLREARKLRGWTQEEAAAQLEPHLGERWSVAVFSAAERSVAGKRVRQFTADDIAAFAAAFDLPPGWFVSERAVSAEAERVPRDELARDIEGARRVIDPRELKLVVDKLRGRVAEHRRLATEDESLANSLSTLVLILEQGPPGATTGEDIRRANE
jgi:transcriptional regulator with XRE-family HTH domain